MRLYTLPGANSFAAAYGSGTYGSGTYSCTGTCTATAASNSSNGTLTNTGIAVGLIVGVAGLVLALAILVRFWRRPAKKVPQVQPEEAQADDEPQAPAQK